MPKISPDEYARRRDQIIDACAALYSERGYVAITVAAVAERITFGRANVYNYFANKDEIALALLAREHDAWADDLRALAAETSGVDDDRVVSALAESLERRHAMLRLLALSLSAMEQNARPERLAEFKASYLRSADALKDLLAVVRPMWDTGAREDFVFAFLPFLHGVYPYAHRTEKQLKAMAEAGVPELGRSITELVSSFLSALLAGIDARASDQAVS